MRGSYREVFRQPGVAALLLSLLVARFGGQMVGVVTVLFVLERYHSPALAGLVALASILPGTLTSPLAGALLDRYGRIHLIVFDYVVGALTGVTIALLAAADALPPWLLVLVCALSSLSYPLAGTGARSLVPLLLPPRLWDRGNALDALTYEASSILGPAVAGFGVALIGALPTLVALGATWIAGALLLLRVSEPAARSTGDRHLLREAWDGLVYVLLRNRALRAISILVPVANIASGISLIAVPVLVLTRLHGGPAQVGLLWSAMGAGGVAGNLLGGRIPSAGRERRLIAIGYGGSAAGLLILAAAPNLAAAAAGLFLGGLLTGFGDISMFGLRQRAAEPEWLGRAMSISMMVNAAGRPVGSGAAGPLIAVSVRFALLAGALAWAASGALAALLLRRLPAPDVGASHHPGQVGGGVAIVDLDLQAIEPGLTE